MMPIWTNTLKRLRTDVPGRTKIKRSKPQLRRRSVYIRKRQVGCQAAIASKLGSHMDGLHPQEPGRL